MLGVIVVIMYHIKAKPGVVTINGKPIKYDSQNELKLIEWLERSGFSGLWQRNNIGAVNGSSRYTNDFELSVLHDGQTKRAIVEAKPYKTALTPNIIKRMQGTMSFYKTDLLLLYIRDNNTWYRIDAVGSGLSEYGNPVPGLVPPAKLPKSFSLTTEKRAGKQYHKPLNPVRWVATLIEEVVRGPKPKRRHKK